MKRRLTLSLLALGAAGQAFAGGYQVSVQGQKQIGMGHTGTALAWDASSLFFNPGSLGFLKKNSIVAGASFINSTVAYVGPNNSAYRAETQNPISTPFAAYGAFFLDKNKKLVLAAGAYTPFGSTVKWGEGWRGQFLLNELSLRAIYTNATVAYRINDMFSVGAGFNYAFGSVDLRRSADVNTGTATAPQYGQAQLKGDASGIGFNAGIHAQLTEELSIGVSYRSKVDMKVSGGDATIRTSSALLGSTFPASGATKFDATLPLPANTNLGIGYKVNKDLTLAADITLAHWSAYKELRFDFAENFGTGLSSASPRNYKDAFIYRVGANYQASKLIALRGGAYLDQTPVEAGYMTPETPDANRLGLTLGIGITPIENLSIDASLLFINGAKREQTQADINAAGTQTAALPGTYQQRAFAPGIQVSYAF